MHISLSPARGVFDNRSGSRFFPRNVITGKWLLFYVLALYGSLHYPPKNVKSPYILKVRRISLEIWELFYL